MNLLDLLVGKKMKVMTDMKVEIELEIKLVEQNNHSVDPSTQENDWWPASRDWTTYTVTYTNGAIKKFDNLSDIKII